MKSRSKRKDDEVPFSWAEFWAIVAETYHGGLRDVTWAQRHFPFVDLQMMIAWRHHRMAHLQREAEKSQSRSGRKNRNAQIDAIRKAKGLVDEEVGEDGGTKNYDDITRFAKSLGF